MKEVTFRFELSDEVLKKLNNEKTRNGRTRKFIARRALEYYLDVLDGKLEIIESETDHAEQQRAHN